MASAAKLASASARGAKRVSSALAAALNAGDLETACACFTHDACLLTPDGTAMQDRGRIRPVLAQLIAMRPDIHVDQDRIMVAGDVALATERWTIRIAGPAGVFFSQTSESAAVLRCLEKVWKLQISAPWGWG